MPAAKTKTDPRSVQLKTAPGLVTVRLQLTPAERDRLRVVAAQAGKPMAIWCRESVRTSLEAAEK